MKRSAARKTAWAAAAAVLGAAVVVPAVPARGADPAEPVFFRDPDAETRKRIEGLITRCTADAVQTRRRARAELESLGYWSVEPLLAALRGREPPVRCAAALTLSALGDRRAVEPLREAVVREDGNAYVAAWAALGLGRFRDGAAVDPLRRALANPKDLEMLRVAAPYVLAKLRTPEALDLLREQLADNGATEPVASARLLALGFFPDAALTPSGDRPGPLLDAGLASRRRGERQSALLAFLVATARSRSGRDWLVAFADTDQPPQVAAVAVVGLASFPDADVTERIARIARGGGPDTLREFACDVLVERADPSALPTLLQLVRVQTSARLRASAVLALGRIESPDARDAVLDRLRDRATVVRAAAAVAAARSGDAELRAESLARIAARLDAGETDARVREVFQLARSVLSGDRRDVTWPPVGSDPVFTSVLATPRQRLLAAVNRRVEVSLDLGKITDFQTEDGIKQDFEPGIPADLDGRGHPIEGVPGEEGGAPPSPAPLPSAPIGSMGAQRTSAWPELRDLLTELSHRRYFEDADLPVPPAARTEPEKR